MRRLVLSLSLTLLIIFLSVGDTKQANTPEPMKSFQHMAVF
jgi:hypothetical protein